MESTNHPKEVLSKDICQLLSSIITFLNNQDKDYKIKNENMKGES